MDLGDKWRPHPVTYLSVCVDGFPNWFFSLGPNSAVGSGSLLAVIEHQVDYAVAAAAKMQRERLKSMEVKREAVEDYDEYLEVRVMIFVLVVNVAHKLGRWIALLSNGGNWLASVAR